MSEANGLPLINVYLCMPYSYTIEPDASDSFDAASLNWERICKRYGHLRLHSSKIRSSILVEAFNTGVASAKSGKYDVFAMQHSDIEAPIGWLPQLYKASCEAGVDVIHACACIKDDRYLTSTSVAYSTDPYTRKRRLTVHELYRLPEVFTVEDVQREIDPDALMLLFNPGCCLIHMKPWFYEWPGFETLSKVIEVKPGQYLQRTISEDYVFGHWCYDHGVKLAATRGVVTNHIGRKKYSTDRPQGLECDRDYLLAAGKPPVAPGRFVFPNDVDGWLTATEGVALAKLARSKRVLEIGSYCGRSTICMAQTAGAVVAVDPHDGRGTPQPQDTLPQFLANLARYKVANVTIEKATAQDFAATWEGEPFDIVFIDGAHDYESVKSDIEVALRFLRDGGVLAFHDYQTFAGEQPGWAWDEGVSKAVNELLEGGSELIERAGTVAVVRPQVVIERVLA